MKLFNFQEDLATQVLRFAPREFKAMLNNSWGSAAFRSQRKGPNMQSYAGYKLVL